MMRIIRAAQRHTQGFGWLQTAWLFSFDEYYDSENVQFGALRVFNDDTVQPGKGFDLHPHREAEIITIPLSGEITHEDNMGNKGTIGPGDVQRMTAGTGVQHAEYNRGSTPVHLYQIWFIPQVPALPPAYQQQHYDYHVWRGHLFPIASGQQGMATDITFHADATIYRADLDPGTQLEYPLNHDRWAFLYLTQGDLMVNGELLTMHDQARMQNETRLKMQSLEHTQFLLIDLAGA